MARIDETSLGGTQALFKTTVWEQIIAARTLDEGRRKAILNEVLTRYWKPVYCYLRRRGYGNDGAKDLTQGFFVEIVLGRDLVRKADPQKGRFRSFLLTALGRYVIDVHRREQRRVEAMAISLDWQGPPAGFEPVEGATPETAFHRAWAAELLDGVIAEAERACGEAGQEKHWQVFCEWELRPIMEGVPRPGIEDMCGRLGIGSRKEAHNMGVTVKRRFRRIMEERVRQFVGCEADVEQEIAELIEILSQGRADG